MAKRLDKVTLVLVDTQKCGDALYSLNKSLEQIEPARTIWFTNRNIKTGNDKIEIVKIPQLGGKGDYSHFIIKELWKYIETDYVLITQWDAWVLNGDAWDDEWLKYDYIGAPWNYIDGRNIGNGGFSLRSQKLQAILGHDDNINIFHPEDDVICRTYRLYLQIKYHLRWPENDDIADKFAFELRKPVYNTFGFHGFHHTPYRPMIVVTRKGALGDVIALEPLLCYFYKRGFNVCLNTMDEFFDYYRGHYYKVYHKSELDSREIVTEINLDKSYEVMPKQLHLQSYYDICGISDPEIRNPIIVLQGGVENYKMFDKYVVIHIDKRQQASRNIEGVNWKAVAQFIKSKGFTPLQVGKNEHEEIEGAVFFNAPNAGALTALLGNCDLFVGIDSGVFNLSVALQRKCVVMSGSVNLEYIIPNMSQVTWLHNHDKKVCDKPFCWHETVGTTGTPCYLGDSPCNRFRTNHVIEAINKNL